MGFFLKTRQPQQFNFRPYYYKPSGERRIKFRRATHYDPYRHSSNPWLYLALMILIALLIFIMGGVRNRATPPVLTIDDVAGTLKIAETPYRDLLNEE